MRLLDDFSTIVRRLRSQTVDCWIGLDLTMAQLKALLTVEHQEAATIGQIADALGVTLPTASHLVDRLVQAGLVTRAEDPSDRRRMIARLSPEGLTLLASLRQGSRDRLQRWIDQLDPADRAALSQGLAALAAVATRGPDASPTVEGQARSDTDKSARDWVISDEQ